MANSKCTINEELLRKKLLDYRVDFDPACLTSLENEIAQVKTHAHIELPDKKYVIRFSMIAAGILILAVIGYFVVQAIQTSNAEKEESKVEIAPKPVIEEPKVETPITPTVAIVDTIKPEVKNTDTISVAAVPEKKVENMVAEKKREEKKVKKAVVQQVDSMATRVDTASKKTSVDSSSANNEQPSLKKKKKKRKNVLDATQDIRNAAPTTADDKVVVPNN
jgi:hypothetical protein